MPRTAKQIAKLVRSEYARECGDDPGPDVAMVYADRYLDAHSHRMSGAGYCPGGFCCEGEGTPDLPDPEPPEHDNDCPECGAHTGTGTCYQCQCYLHSIGAYDMDGEGYR